MKAVSAGQNRISNNFDSTEKGSEGNGENPRLSLTILDGPRTGERIHLQEGIHTFGGENSDFFVEEEHLCELEVSSQGVLLRNLTKIPIFVNDQKVQERPLVNFDEIRLGSSLLLFLEIGKNSSGDSSKVTLPETLEMDTNNFVSDPEDTTSLCGIVPLPGKKLPPGIAVYIEVLEGEDAGSSFELSIGKRFLITRKSGQIILNDQSVSRRHGIIYILGEDQYFLIDLGSKNGTQLNGRRVLWDRIKSGDSIRVGNSTLRFIVVSSLRGGSNEAE